MEKLLAHFARHVQLTSEETEAVRQAFKSERVKKRQFIVMPGFPARYRNYVVKGAFRAYVVCKDGIEHTIQFAIDDWYISDYNSYIFQKNATMFVLALESGEILRLSHEDEAKLKSMSHNFETYFRTLAERGVAHFQRRIITNLTLSAEDRYEHFMRHYAHIEQRVPQYALASYLGMTTEYLSKIRNNRIHKK